MTSRCSTSAANIASKGGNWLCSGQLHCLAWFSPAETRKGLCFLPKPRAPFQRLYHCHRIDYVSARAEARSNSNAIQGHARSVAFKRLRFSAMLRRVTAGYHAGTVPPTPATPNPSIEGMPKRLRLLCTPHVKR
jgi:hypothetical protein